MSAGRVQRGMQQGLRVGVRGQRTLGALVTSAGTLGAVVTGCGGPSAETDVVIVALSPSADEAVGWAADELRETLVELGFAARLERTRTELRCKPGRVWVQLLGDGLGDARLEATDWSRGLGAPHPEDAAEDERRMGQTHRIEVERCGQGALVTLSGAGRLGRQYAVYEWLHSLGVRYFHPEQTWLPEVTPKLSRERARDEIRTPAFRDRGVTLHLTHPLELGDAFRLGDQAYFDEAARFIDWQIHNGASLGTAGVSGAGGALAERGLRRGFARTASVNLRNAQQGGMGLVGGSAPASRAQIAQAIDEVVGDDPERYPEFLGINLRLSEFHFVEDEQAVSELTHAAQIVAEAYPSITLQTTAHATASEATPNYGVPFSLLPQFAPENLGVVVHPLMFYDLFRPAPVYGNTDYGYLLEFMRQEAPGRELWYYPEAAWWLTFDIAIPLYLPITIDARGRDIRGIAPLLADKLRGHQIFGSGHEWGYWQNEYCALRMSMDLAFDAAACLGEITDVMGDAAEPVRGALEQVIEWQARDLFDREVLRWLVGTDPETELAASAGIEFHPLPPTPEQIAAWDEAELAAWLEGTAPRLARIEGDYLALARELAPQRADVPARARGFFSEIVDGIEAFGLRARHQRHAYAALIEQRVTQLGTDPDADLASDAAGAAASDAGGADPSDAGDGPLLHARLSPAAHLAAAELATRAVLEVIARREAGYRYQPLARSIAGGPNGDADENWTTYPFRYLNRTHHAYYYRAIDERVANALGGDALELRDAVLGPAEPLRVELGPEVAAARADFGDGERGLYDARSSSSAQLSHAYAAPGVYTLDVEATPQQREPVAASASDANASDANASDANPRDAGPRDASPRDPNPSDPNPSDASPSDASPTDAALSDAGASSAPGMWRLRANIAALAQEHHTGLTGSLTSPEGAALIEGTLPGLVFGPIDERFAVIGFAARESSEVSSDDWARVELDARGPGFTSLPTTLLVPVIDRASASVLARVRILEARITWPAPDQPVRFLGRVDTESLVQATLAVVGGSFDEAGARAFIAALLGYDATQLPTLLDYELQYAPPAP